MLRKNVAGQFIYFAGINATTGAFLTGATFSGRRAIDGTFDAIGGAISEDTGTGFYKVALTQADTNGNDIAFFFTATNAVPVCMTVLATAANPSDVTAYGLTNIDVAVSTRLATAGYTAPLDASGTRTAIGLASADLDAQLAALPTAAEIVAAQLTTAITEAYRANGTAPTLAQFMSEVLAHLGEMTIVGTTKTINRFDHTTAAETFTLNSATAPTAIQRAT
jgi:hypothetical protein